MALDQNTEKLVDALEKLISNSGGTEAIRNEIAGVLEATIPVGKTAEDVENAGGGGGSNFVYREGPILLTEEESGAQIAVGSGAGTQIDLPESPATGTQFEVLWMEEVVIGNAAVRATGADGMIGQVMSVSPMTCLYFNEAANKTEIIIASGSGSGQRISVWYNGTDWVTTAIGLGLTMN